MILKAGDAYKRLALAACREAGIALPAGGEDGAALDAHMETIASAPEARQVRDCAWLEYEALLRQPETYPLDRILAWLNERGVEIGRSSIHRDRVRLLRVEMSHKLANEKLAAIFQTLKGISEDELYQGGLKLAMQHLLTLFLDLSAESFEGLKPAQLLLAMDTFARLGNARADTALKEARSKELERRFDEAIQQRTAGRAERALTGQDIEAIRKAVFG